MKNIKQPKSIIIIIILILVGISFTINYNKRNSEEYIIIEKDQIFLLVADTLELRMKGLSGVKNLEGNTAMLFVFNYPDKHGIWMKDMLFALDIIWLDEQYKIVSIEKNISPNTYPKVFYPTEKSLYVMEGKAGFVERNGIMVGKVLNLSKK